MTTPVLPMMSNSENDSSRGVDLGISGFEGVRVQGCGFWRSRVLGFRSLAAAGGLGFLGLADSHLEVRGLGFLGSGFWVSRLL